MNKIVREHYPAAKLPDDLRAGIDPARQVTVTVVEEDAEPGASILQKLLKDVRDADAGERRYSVEEMRKRVEELHAKGLIQPTSVDEAVARIRALRDEWDD